MWEGSRMMLPEHIQALRERKRKATHDPQPNLTEDELTELGHVAMDSLYHTIEVTVVYWQDGYDQRVTGVIDEIDSLGKRLKLNGEWINITVLKRIDRV